MLTLTPNATAIVKEIATQPGLSETAGLRITSESETDPAFAVTAASTAPTASAALLLRASYSRMDNHKQHLRR